jgi:SAM-dependent methyltransferase
VAGRAYTRGSVSDLSPLIPAAHAAHLASHIDRAGKLLRALDALGPIAGRDVAIVDPGDGRLTDAMAAAGARVVVAPGDARGLGLPDGSLDVLVGAYTSYRGVDGAELAEADRALRPGGRLLVIHDYGRDDVSRLGAADRPELGAWSRRDGPFLRGGFKVRVVHCWWTFESVEEASDVLATAFGEAGASLAAALSRPRLAYNVAVYHRSRAGG